MIKNKMIISYIFIVITFIFISIKQYRHIIISPETSDLKTSYMVAEQHFENKEWQEIYKTGKIGTSQFIPFFYAPIWLNYFKLIKPYNPMIIQSIILLICSITLYVMWIKLFKLDILNSSVLFMIMFYGIWNGWFIAFIGQNVSLIEMLFLWMGIVAIIKNYITLSQLCLLIAGSFKFHWWIFGLIYLIIDDKNKIKNIIIFISMILGYFIINYILYPETTRWWIHYLPLYTHPFGIRNMFIKYQYSKNIFEIFWAVILIPAICMWYYLIHKNKINNNIIDIILLLIFVIINILPRFNPYQFIYLVPVLMWIYNKIKDKTLALLFILPTFIIYSWNIYYITFYCWILMIYVMISMYNNNNELCY